MGSWTPNYNLYKPAPHEQYWGEAVNENFDKLDNAIQETGSFDPTVEDALHATKAAIEEGIVPGGGVALLFAREGITYEKSNQAGINVGKQIVYKACGKPFYQILMNAGYTESEIYPISAEIGKMGEIDSKPRFGYDINSETIVDMISTGILDPSKCTRLSLVHAASVAQTILLTEVIVADLPDDKKPEIDPMMGMM